MKTYIDHGGVLVIGNMSIPPDSDNLDYARALAEVAAGEAEVVPAPPPPPPAKREPTPQEVLDLLVAKGIIVQADADGIIAVK